RLLQMRGAADAQRALARHGLDLRHFLAQLAKLLHAVVLPQRNLEARPEKLLGRRLLVVRELLVAQTANLFKFHNFLAPGSQLPALSHKTSLPESFHSTHQAES